MSIEDKIFFIVSICTFVIILIIITIMKFMGGKMYRVRIYTYNGRKIYDLKVVRYKRWENWITLYSEDDKIVELNINILSVIINEVEEV